MARPMVMYPFAAVKVKYLPLVGWKKCRALSTTLSDADGNEYAKPAGPERNAGTSVNFS